MVKKKKRSRRINPFAERVAKWVNFHNSIGKSPNLSVDIGLWKAGTEAWKIFNANCPKIASAAVTLALQIVRIDNLAKQADTDHGSLIDSDKLYTATGCDDLLKCLVGLLQIEPLEGDPLTDVLWVMADVNIDNATIVMGIAMLFTISFDPDRCINGKSAGDINTLLVRLAGHTEKYR
jgi:hypothetical protein